VGAISVWYDIKQDMPAAEETVRVIGQQWAWSFQQAGPDGVMDTADDIRSVGELHVKVDTTYHFDLISRDVVHSFAVPAFRLKQDALPGRTITGWFRPNKVGTYDIQCTQMCGLGHGLMAGRIIVETAQDHAAWLMRNASPATAGLPPAAPAPTSDGVVTMAEARQ
jgi:cytochrome c oxidase subunit 2